VHNVGEKLAESAAVNLIISRS